MEIRGRGSVFINDFGNFVINDAQKNLQTGEYENFYIPISFKKDMDVPNNGDFIEFEGFTKPYKSKKDDKVHVSYFVMSWRLSANYKKTKATDYKYYVVRTEKKGDYQYIVQRATSKANVKANVERNIPEEYFENYYHFDDIIAEFSTREEAEKYIKQNYSERIQDPFADFGKQVSLDNFLE